VELNREGRMFLLFFIPSGVPIMDKSIMNKSIMKETC